jgi:CHAT domain-containing protein
LNAAADTALAQARHALDHAQALAAPGADARALAWALKDLCYEAWRSEPTRAARAAQLLAELQRSAVPAAQALEVQGLAAWTEGIAQLTRGQMADAVKAFDHAAQALRDAGLPDPAAQTQVPKIMALSMLGQHDEAAACAETTQRELLKWGNVAAASRVSLNLGSLQMHRDAYPQAARHYREAVVLFARLGQHEDSVFADTGLADALTSMGDTDEALRIYARARMRAGHRGLAPLLAVVDESEALVELTRGRYAQALAGLESARRRYETLQLPQYLAIAEKQLGDVYLELRLLPEALALLSTAVDKFQALGLPDEAAWAQLQRGRAQAMLGQATAADAFGAASALFTAQGNRVGEAAVALARAELALAAGDAGAALGWADGAAAAFTAAEHADGRARAQVVRGMALLGSGRVDDAGALFDDTLAAARAAHQRSVQVRCLTGQGLVALAQGHSERARACFDAAIEFFEEQRRALPGDEIRSAFLTDHLRPYEERLRMAVHSGDGAHCLLQLERIRARVLDERLAQAPAAEGADDEELQALRHRLNWLYRRVQRLQEEGESAASFSAELQGLERDLLERTRRQRLAAPARAGAVAADFSVAALQAALQDGDALVEYGRIDDELFACVVTPQAVTLVRQLAPWSRVLEAVRSLRFQMDTLRHGVAPVQAHLATLTERARLRLAQLQALVWAPLTTHLHGTQRVVLVPHAQLGALPFAALPDGAQSLGVRYRLALAPSARMALRGLQRPPSAARWALALGEPSRLPHAGREAQSVARLFEQGQLLLGAQATVAALQQHAPAADVLHLACHAQFRSDNPVFSALHLHDGALTAELAEGLALKPCTVVLSACETGLAEAGSGDEMVGLVRAFLVAGASRVVASLWPVDDAVTAAFMACFYRALVAGSEPAAALQRAQAAIARDHPHPYFWGAFTLYGGW